MRSAIALVALLCMFSTAQATWVSNETRLEWLELTATQGLSRGDIIDGVGGWRDAGWRLATTSEVCQLFAEFGIVIDPCPDGWLQGYEYEERGRAFLNVFGILPCCGNLVPDCAVGHLLNPPEDPGSQFAYARVQVPASGFTTMGVIFDSYSSMDEAYECVGNFLVRRLQGANAVHKIAVHTQPHGNTTCNRNFPSIEGCEDIVCTYGPCGDVDVFPVFYDLSEVSRIQYGLTWPAEWGSCVFQSCIGDQSIGEIAYPGDGYDIVWLECQQVSTLVCGVGWLYADFPGQVTAVADPGHGFVGTFDCSNVQDDPAGVSPAGICGTPGGDPCGTAGVVQTTWGKVKSLFE